MENLCKKSRFFKGSQKFGDFNGKTLAFLSVSNIMPDSFLKSSMDWEAWRRQNHLLRINQEHIRVLRVLVSVPEDKLYWRPHAKSRNFSACALHIYEAGLFLIRFLQGDHPASRPEAPPPETKDLLLEKCKTLHHDYCQAVETLTLEQLRQYYQFYYQGTRQGIDILDQHPDHMIHHRAQLQLYLRLMNEPCPVIYGATADAGWDIAAQLEDQLRKAGN